MGKNRVIDSRIHGTQKPPFWETENIKPCFLNTLCMGLVFDAKFSGIQSFRGVKVFEKPGFFGGWRFSRYLKFW